MTGFFEKSLSAKFFFIVAVILIVCTLVAGIVISLRERSLLKNSLLDKGKSLTSYIAKISREPLLMKDAIRLRRRHAREQRSATERCERDTQVPLHAVSLPLEHDDER